MKVSDLKGSDLDRAVAESRPVEKHIKVQVSELIGPALDWAVAKCEGLRPYFDGESWILFDGQPQPDVPLPHLQSDWLQGGPIVEMLMKKGMLVEGTDPRLKIAPFRASFDKWDTSFYGPTLLVAAMRCYVANQIGIKIEIPAEINSMVLEPEAHQDDFLSGGPR